MKLNKQAIILQTDRPCRGEFIRPICRHESGECHAELVSASLQDKFIRNTDTKAPV